MIRALCLITLTSLLLQACASSGDKLSPTIADLEHQAVDIQPQVSFDIDRQRVIDSYRELVSITPQQDPYGKEVQRLADLELESSMDKQLSEDPATVDQGKQETALAISRYQQYLQTYPGRADNDLIMYQLARAYALESEVEKARQVMDQLVSQYPQSRYIDEVQFRRGENLFVAGDYAGAEQAYGVVVRQYPDSIYYEKALYKYGWSQFKQNQYNAAIQSYVSLLDRKQQQAMLDEIKLSDQLPRAEQELLDDVLRVMSLAFSYQPARQPISQHFNRAGKRPYEPLLYLKLGELYLGKERVTDATDIYLSYGENYPFSAYTPVFHGLAIDAFKEAGFTSALLPEKENYVQKYDKGSAYWAQQTAETQAMLQPILTAHMRDIATHYHATARASKKAPDYRRAAGWYQRFLDSFPQDPNAAEINFLLAETRYDAGEYEKAINEYEKTAYQYPSHKNSAEAGYAALVSYNSLYKKSALQQKPVINERLIQSSLRFSSQFPNDKRMPSVLLKTAEQFFDLKRFNEARDTSRRLAGNPQITDRKIQHSAWVILAHSQFELSDFASAEVAYKEVLNSLPKNDKTRGKILEQLASSIYKQGEQARQIGEHQIAAEHFLRVGKTVPGSPTRVVADYDAATEYVTLKNWPLAISLLETFRKKYPKQKKWQQGVSEKLALAYSSSGQPARAAGEMLTLVKLVPKDQQQDLLWQTAELYNQAGKTGQAVATYKTYVKQYPQPLSRSIELRNKIAQYYAERKDTKNHHYWLNEIVKADSNAKQQRNDRSRYLAATASLELIRPLHTSYSKTRLTIPLKKSLKRKKDLMTKTINAYTKAARYQVEEVTTASTFSIAEIYREFASALLKSDRPKNLNEEELEEYNYLLEDQAYPFEEKAISIHQSNLNRIPDGSWDSAIQNSLAALGKMMPFRYAKSEITEPYVEFQP